MERSVCDRTDLVWARPERPPKARTAITAGNAYVKDTALATIMGIPEVISSIPASAVFVCTDSGAANRNCMEDAKQDHITAQHGHGCEAAADRLIDDGEGEVGGLDCMTGVGNALCGKLPGLFFCVPMVAAIPVNRQSPSENSAADNRQSVDAQQCRKQQFPPPKTAADDKTGQKPGADVVGEAQKIGGFRSGQLLSFIQIRHRPGPQRIAAQEADENAGGPLRCGVEEPPQQRISHGADGGDEAAADQETGQQENGSKDGISTWNQSRRP